ncbi:MAG: 6-bladed beta-propeller [Bacteroidia bacterium]|nr:6-bladed beta-propeller [Bacteroidia bacterium]
MTGPKLSDRFGTKGKVKSCLAVFLSVFFFTLNTQGQEQTYKIDLSGNEQESVDMNLSTIAAEVNYIALETKPDSYLTSIFKLVKTDYNLLVLDRTAMKRERLVIFNLNGSFKALINRVGKGPGEYSAIEDFAFDPENQSITILDSGQKKFLQFTLSGQFIREARMDIRPSDMCYIEPGFFVTTIPLRMVKPADDGKLNNIIIYDRELKVKKRISTLNKSLESPDSPFIMTGGMTSFENQLRYKQPFVNDIYTVDKNLDYRIFCKMEFGKYKVPESKYASIGGSRSDDNYKEYHNMVESRNFLFIKYRYNKMICTYLYSKTNNTMTNLSGEGGNFGITNDFDGSMAFWPDLSSGADELIRSFNAIEFMELCNQNHTKKFKSKFPAQQKKLLDVLGKLREDSNPVIQVVTLRKL